MADYRDPRKQQNSGDSMPSLGKTIAKVAIGACFVAVGLEDIFTDFSGTMIGIIIGIALIAWGLIPYMEAKRKLQAEETERILKTPFPNSEEDEEDEAERLAKKYYNK